MPRSSGRAKRHSAVKAAAKLPPKQNRDELRSLLDRNAQIIYAAAKPNNSTKANQRHIDHENALAALFNQAL
ncbi:hypothetical protein AX14_004404 [Amanita brunnescens Koide BX004]|nr:hypothetical protein AX14_004404 [Amanita brunnescens Koide BX004]